MAILDNIQFETSNTFSASSERHAWACFAVACTRFDDYMDDTQSAKMTSALSMCNVFGLNRYVDVLELAILSQIEYGSHAIIKGSMKYILPEDYPTLFCYCCDLIFCSNFNEGKAVLLKFIAEALQIPDDFANKVIEVMIVRNKKDVKNITINSHR